MKRISDAINESFGDLTKNQKVLSQYILAECDKAAFMTAAEIAEAAGVSQSTVVRFAWALGYGAFSAFHSALQNELQYRITALEKFELLDSEELSDSSVFESLAQADTLNIKKTLAVNGADGLKNVCARLQFAAKIYIYGQGPCACGAYYMGSYLRALLGSVCVVNQTGEDPLSTIATIGSSDLLFCISLPRYTEQTRMLLRYAQRRDACIVTVSEGSDSETASFADINLSAECGDYGAAGSLAPLLTLLNALVCLIVRNDEKAERRLRLVDELPRYLLREDGR